MPGSTRALLGNAGSLLGAIAATSLLGFPYWWLAARMFRAEAVGFAAATISAMTLLGTFGMLGLGTLLTGELPRQARDRGPLMATALVSAACAGLVLGLLFGVVGPGLLGLHALAGHIGPILLFASGVGLTSTTMVVDQALIGLLHGALQLWRNLVFAVSKLVVLAAIGLASSSKGGLAIYATWVVGLVISMAWLAVVARREGARLRDCRPRWSLFWRWRRPATAHHVLNLALLAPTRALPLVAAAVVSVTASAYYYTASLITSFLAYGAIALTYALYAVGARDAENLARTLRFTLRLAFGVILLANVVLFVGARLILRAFGPQYAAQATTALRIMGVYTLLMIIKDHYVAIARIRGTLFQAAALAGAGCVLELALASVGGSLDGIPGVALGALIALTLEVTVMSRSVVRELRRRPPQHSPSVPPKLSVPEVSP